MKHLKKFNEALEPEIINAIKFLKKKKMDGSEDLNIERNEIRIITDVIIKNYNKSYPEIAKILGIPIRTFFRKLKDYDLEDLKSQVKLRGGKGWNHPYNKIDINEN